MTYLSHEGVFGFEETNPVKDDRPIYLNLFQYKWPLVAIASILHRISGVGVFFGIGVLLFLLQASLESQSSFDLVRSSFQSPGLKILTWLIVSGLIYHFVAGVKHLIMDWGFGEDLRSAHLASQATIAVATISSLLAGVWLW
jgi:succinate dehydrogenase / fumarate reductase cytochrome b subunit